MSTISPLTFQSKSNTVFWTHTVFYFTPCFTSHRVSKHEGSVPPGGNPTPHGLSSAGRSSTRSHQTWGVCDGNRSRAKGGGGLSSRVANLQRQIRWVLFTCFLDDMHTYRGLVRLSPSTSGRCLRFGRAKCIWCSSSATARWGHGLMRRPSEHPRRCFRSRETFGRH